MTIFIQTGLLIIGFIMLIKGADWFVDGASGIADRFGIPQLVIGLTIVAFGTSAPEAAVSITAALKGNAAIAIGNIVGSNILNILIILGVTSVIVPIAVQKSTLRVEIPYMIFTTVLLLGLGYFGADISFMDGIILWIAFILFLIYLIIIAKKGNTELCEQELEQDFEVDLDEDLYEVKNTKFNTGKLGILTIVGLVLVIFGSDVTVNSATRLAEIFGISERFIGLTIVALGTSLPELFTSLSAAIKGKADIAIGNIVGSNIFNILFVLGTTSLITTIPFASGFIIDTVVAVVAAILLFLCVLKTQSLRRRGGVVMLIIYVMYYIYLIL